MTVTCACGTVGERELATGRFADTLNGFGWDCAACTDSRERWAEEEAVRKRYSQRDRVSSVPRALRKSLADLQTTTRNAQALEAARAFVAGDLKALALIGPVGVGKTTIAAAAAWERQLIRPTLWVSVPVMLANVLKAFGDEERAAAMQTITGNGALALDDLDKCSRSEWAAAQLFAAIDSRVAAGRPLLVTMNLTPGELEAKIGGEFGAAIASRLVGYCETVLVDDVDRRLVGDRHRLRVAPTARER